MPLLRVEPKGQPQIVFPGLGFSASKTTASCLFVHPFRAYGPLLFHAVAKLRRTLLETFFEAGFLGSGMAAGQQDQARKQYYSSH